VKNLIIVSLLVAGASGCLASLGDPKVAAANRTYRQECGSCHPRPAREHLDRAGWEKVLPTHRGRVAMSDEQWTVMLDFLSEPTEEQQPRIATQSPAAPK